MSQLSMTGFGKAEAKSEDYTLTVEIKSVNHRFKDIRFKMSSLFNELEIPLKRKLEEKFKRGSFDIYVNYKKAEKLNKQVDIDVEKIKSYISKIQAIADDMGAGFSVNPTEFLRNDFYVDDDSKADSLKELVTPAFEQALISLENSRTIEGGKLVEKLKEHQNVYKEHYEAVKGLRNSYQDKVKEKLLSRFENLSGIEVDTPRMHQEVIYYLEKLDIDEEINRIAIHLEKLDKVFSSKKEIGREIDFLVQELNRETNTIGSKSGSSDISENVVQMKVQLEKIREQGLNLE